MIFTAIINFFLSIVNYLISWFPSVTSNDTLAISNINNAFSTFRGYVASANWWFPIDDLFITVGIVIAVSVVVFCFQLVKWLAANLSGGIVKK
jgi:hypothetical protein